MKNFRNLLWGIVLIVIGVILGLNTLEITKINLFFDGWWTFIIIIPCFIDLFKKGSKTGNLIGVLIGVSLFLACQGIIDFDLLWELLIPVVLVIIGLSFVFKDLLNNKVKKEINKLSNNKTQEYWATFGGQNLNFSNEKFEGCKLTAVFGGVKCDLTDSIIKKDVVIEISSIFGGVTLIVPKDIKVKINSTPIFGGVSDERKDVPKDSEVTIYVNAVSIFGGVEIK